MSVTPALKGIAGVGTMAAVQASTLILSKKLNNNDNNNDTSNKIIDNIIYDLNNQELQNKFPDYSLNILPKMNQLVNVEILFLYLLLNVFIINILINSDYKKYLPNNKIGKLLDFFYFSLYQYMV